MILSDFSDPIMISGITKDMRHSVSIYIYLVQTVLRSDHIMSYFQQGGWDDQKIVYPSLIQKELKKNITHMLLSQDRSPLIFRGVISDIDDVLVIMCLKNTNILEFLWLEIIITEVLFEHIGLLDEKCNRSRYDMREGIFLKMFVGIDIDTDQQRSTTTAVQRCYIIQIRLCAIISLQKGFNREIIGYTSIYQNSTTITNCFETKRNTTTCFDNRHNFALLVDDIVSTFEICRRNIQGNWQISQITVHNMFFHHFFEFVQSHTTTHAQIDIDKIS